MLLVLGDLDVLFDSGEGFNLLGHGADVFGGGATAAANEADAEFDQAFGVFAEVFGGGHVDEAAVDFLGKTGIGAHGEGFLGERKGAFGDAEGGGGAETTVDAEGVNGGGGIELADDLFDGFAATGFAVFADGNRDEDG